MNRLKIINLPVLYKTRISCTIRNTDPMLPNNCCNPVIVNKAGHLPLNNVLIFIYHVCLLCKRLNCSMHKVGHSFHRIPDHGEEDFHLALAGCF